MSSSAAVECGFAFALNQLFGFGINKMDLVKLGPRSENNFVGMSCSIRDEYQVSSPDLDFLVDAASTVPGLFSEPE